MSGYKNLTVAQLKDELRKKGLPTTGRKADLIERLTQTPVLNNEEELVYFIDKNGEEFSIPYRYIRGLNLVEELRESGLEGKLEIPIKTSKILFFISLGPTFLKNLATEELEEYVQNLDFFGTRTYSHIENDRIVSEPLSEVLYKKRVPIENLSGDPYELQGVLLEAVKAKDTDFLDKNNIFVNEFRALLQKNPYLFANPDDYWIYERYTESTIEVVNPDPDKILLPIDMIVATNIVFDEKDEMYGELLELSETGADKLFIDLWVKQGKVYKDDVGDLYAVILMNNGHSNLVKKMVELGLDINEKDRGQTALIGVAQNSHNNFNGQRVVDLLDLGADPSVIDRRRHSFMYYYISSIPVYTFNNLNDEPDFHPLEDYFTILEPYKSVIIPLLQRSDITEAIRGHGDDAPLVRQAIDNFINS